MAHVAKPTVNVYVLKDGKLLLSRRANTGWADGKLCAPGGHVEAGETPTQAIIREIEEELGVTVRSEDLEFMCASPRNVPGTEHYAFGFIVRDKDYEFTNAEPEKCSELVWVDPENLPEDVIDDFRQIIEKCLDGNEKYLEINYT